MSSLSLNPISLFSVFIILAIIPFLLLSVTSYVKLSIVFSILRNALGAGQIPSGAVCAVLSLVLTLYIMAPVGCETVEQLDKADLNLSKSPLSIAELSTKLSKISEPLEDFLRQHSFERERSFFVELSQSQSHKNSQTGTAKKEEPLAKETFFTLMPAFLITELQTAFSVGFMIFLPFVVVDLIVSHLLVGLGMVMVSPITISLPLKIILFVLSDGWFLLCRSLILAYAV